MFPRLFDELKHTRVYQESIRSVINTQLISIDVLSALSYKPCFIMRLPVSIDLIRLTAMNFSRWKIRDDFVRDDQMEPLSREIEFGRILLKMMYLRLHAGQNPRLTLDQSWRQFQYVILQCCRALSLFNER